MTEFDGFLNFFLTIIVLIIIIIACKKSNLFKEEDIDNSKEIVSKSEDKENRFQEQKDLFVYLMEKLDEIKGLDDIPEFDHYPFKMNQFYYDLIVNSKDITTLRQLEVTNLIIKERLYHLNLSTEELSEEEREYFETLFKCYDNAQTEEANLGKYKEVYHALVEKVKTIESDEYFNKLQYPSIDIYQDKYENALEMSNLDLLEEVINELRSQIDKFNETKSKKISEESERKKLISEISDAVVKKLNNPDENLKDVLNDLDEKFDSWENNNKGKN